jgi:Cd2+/Zn2+-exporting ATPase
MLDPMASPLPGSLLSTTEKWRLGSRLILAGVAGGLLLLSLALRSLVPEQTEVARLVAALAAALVAIPVMVEAWEALISPSLHGVTDLLVAAALIAAWSIGDLETAALVPLAMVIGHVLEERSLLGTRDAIAALSRLGAGTTRRFDGAGLIHDIPVEHLRIGDRIELRAGDRLPADGIVREGASSLNLAALTGESVPVEVALGDAVQAGALNVQGRLVVEVVRLGADTAMGRVVQLMQQAEQAKPPVTRLLERFAVPYLFLVLLAALAALLLGGSATVAMTVLVAACPCALVLAAPAAAVAGIAVAARHGLLVKGTAFLEELAQVDTLVIDKTGTLTLGALHVAEILPADGVDVDHLRMVASCLGAASSHPVSRAVAPLVTPALRHPIDQVTEHGGLGVRALIDQAPALLGRRDFLTAEGLSIPPAPAHDGPLVGVACAGSFLGWILLADEPRAEAPRALAELRAIGIQRQVLLTGDRSAAAARVAGQLAITEVQSEVTPEQKLATVMALVAAGHRPLVVGDGINDALALRAGAVGVAMGTGGTDVALASADLVLTGSDLRRLATGIRLSRRCRSIIAINVGIGLGWTAVVVALAATTSMGPIWAVLLHHVGTLAVVTNAGRILSFDEPLTAA